MKSFITALAMVALLSTPAFAQKKKKTTVHTTTTETAAPASSAPVYSYSGGSSSTYNSGPLFSVAASLGAIDGAFVFGPSFYADWPVNLDGNDFEFGGQTGFWFMDGGWVLPIMATGKYHFRTSGSIKPYAGLGMGISIVHGNSQTINTGFGSVTVGGGSATKFALLVRPGMNFGDGNKFFAELPLGTMGGGFAITPTFGYHF